MAKEISQSDVGKPAPSPPPPKTKPTAASYSFKDLSNMLTNATNIRDHKTQSILLVGLLFVLGIALWYGFNTNCLRRRRRRRRSPCDPCR